MPNKIENAKLITVIETKSTRGDGTSASPTRVVTQYWSVDGKFLAESDNQHHQSGMCDC